MGGVDRILFAVLEGSILDQFGVYSTVSRIVNIFVEKAI